MFALFAPLVNAIVSNARLIFKYVVFGTFIAALTAFSVWFVGFTNDVYNFIINTINSSGIASQSGIIGCALQSLGIDKFINSAFAIFFSAGIFWVTAVGYIITYKLGMKAYDGWFKVL